MLSNIVRAAALAAAFALAACGGPAVVDRKDPKSVITAFVAAYNAKDPKAIVPLVPPPMAEPFETAAADKKGEEYNNMFGKTFADAFAGSHGALDGPRYSPDGIWYKVKDGKEQFTVLQVLEHDGEWYVTSVLFPQAAEYNALPKEKPAK